MLPTQPIFYNDYATSFFYSGFYQNMVNYSLMTEKKYPRLLLVDDDQMYTTIFKDCALGLNFEVEVINDYSEISNLASQEFDIAIIDFDLGPITGQEVSSVLSLMFGSVPIILISSTDQQINQTNPEIEIYDFMQKSFGPGAILDAAIDAHQWWKQCRN